MISKLKTFALGLAVIASALPAFSQGQLSNNQPITRVSTEVETRIQAKLKLDYSKGLFDSTQNASLQRDFDAILVKEDDYKSRGKGDGMSAKDSAKIVEDLSAFEARLDKLSGVSTTAAAESLNGPVVNKNNAGLSTVAPTN